MPAPSARELLDLWERGRTAEPAARALLLLDADQPGAPAAALPVGARNRRLLALRARLFGTALDAVTECPCCHALLEAAVPGPGGAGEVPAGTPGEQVLRRDGWTVRFRVPAAGDLVGLPAQGPEAALLARCVLAASRDGVDVPVTELPAGVVGELDARLAVADPDAVLVAAVGCQACGAGFEAALEPVGYLWAELEQWAWQQLADVHDLARLFGWSQEAVLAMSPWRRRAYLALGAS